MAIPGRRRRGWHSEEWSSVDVEEPKKFSVVDINNYTLRTVVKVTTYTGARARPDTRFKIRDASILVILRCDDEEDNCITASVNAVIK